MRPFTYGLKLTQCYDDGIVFEAKLLSVNRDQVLRAVATGVGSVAALSLGAGFPTLPAFPHVVGAGFRNLLAISLATEYSFKQADAIKARASAAPAAAAAPVAAAAPKVDKAPPKPAPPPVKSSSSEEEFGDIFG